MPGETFYSLEAVLLNCIEKGIIVIILVISSFIITIKCLLIIVFVNCTRTYVSAWTSDFLTSIYICVHMLVCDFLNHNHEAYKV